MTDIERIELAIRRMLTNDKPEADAVSMFHQLADELARMREPPVEHPPGYKINWR